MFDCSRCNGKGRIEFYNHVIGGVCFKCNGSGKQKAKPVKTLKWVVLGINKNTGLQGIVYNKSGKTAKEAIKKARQNFEKASTAFKDEWSLENAVAIEFNEFHGLN